MGFQISRNSETGESRGCGYVTLGSVAAAKAAIIALDESVGMKLS